MHFVFNHYITSSSFISYMQFASIVKFLKYYVATNYNKPKWSILFWD